MTIRTRAVWRFALALSVILAGLTAVPAPHASAATSAVYSDSKYYTAYVEYYANGSTRLIANRRYRGGRGCISDGSCGAEQWRNLLWSDEFRWAGDPTWYVDYQSTGAWYYDPVRDSAPWRCDCVDNSITASSIRVRTRAEFYDQGAYWYSPSSYYYSFAL